MCGIFGQYNPTGADLALIERMAERLQHRGPDGYGTYHHGLLAFGAGRLAIIDLSAPAGPIFNCGRCWCFICRTPCILMKVWRLAAGSGPTT